MADVIYKDGFPEGWEMVHRDDDTLLCSTDRFGMSRALCAAPRLQQGEAWLEIAKVIAHGYSGLQMQFLSFREAAYCDKCGVGPSANEDGSDVETSRAVKTWECDHCGFTNPRPVPPKSATPT